MTSRLSVRRAAIRFAMAVTLFVSGCRAASEAPTSRATPATQGHSLYGVRQLRAMVRTELYCGLSRPDGGDVSDAEWLRFLDEVVTPRFPDGFSVLDGYGQYRETSGKIDHERSKVIVILHQDDADAERRIEEVRHEYVTRFKQESVLRMDDAVTAGF